MAFAKWRRRTAETTEHGINQSVLNEAAKLKYELHLGLSWRLAL
jgi:hypothetical protein